MRTNQVRICVYRYQSVYLRLSSLGRCSHTRGVSPFPEGTVCYMYICSGSEGVFHVRGYSVQEAKCMLVMGSIMQVLAPVRSLPV